jgi:hypothetical protein
VATRGILHPTFLPRNTRSLPFILMQPRIVVEILPFPPCAAFPISCAFCIIVCPSLLDLIAEHLRLPYCLSRSSSFDYCQANF